MTCQESEEVVVKCLELECVLGLVRLHKWIDNQSNWNGFDLLKQVLEVVQVQLPHGLILWALYQRKIRLLRMAGALGFSRKKICQGA